MLACFFSWPHEWDILIKEVWLSKSFSGFWFCVIFIIISVTELGGLALLSATCFSMTRSYCQDQKITEEPGLNGSSKIQPPIPLAVGRDTFH